MGSSLRTCVASHSQCIRACAIQLTEAPAKRRKSEDCSLEDCSPVMMMLKLLSHSRLCVQNDQTGNKPCSCDGAAASSRAWCWAGFAAFPYSSWLCEELAVSARFP